MPVVPQIPCDIVVSIVVPVYNGAASLEDCLKAISDQSYRKIQVIIVDDGSTDDTPHIARRFSQRDSRFEYYQQENRGAGPARNAGLAKADGNYVMFVDADDTLSIDAVLENVTFACYSRADIIVFGYVIDGRKYVLSRLAANLNSFDASVSRSRKIATVLEGGGRLSVWNKMFRNDFLKANSIRFPDVRRGQDMFFTLACYENLGNVHVNPRALYLHSKDRDVKKFDKRMISTHIDLYERMRQVLDVGSSATHRSHIASHYLVGWFLLQLPSMLVRSSYLNQREKRQSIDGMLYELRSRGYTGEMVSLARGRYRPLVVWLHFVPTIILYWTAVALNTGVCQKIIGRIRERYFRGHND